MWSWSRWVPGGSLPQYGQCEARVHEAPVYKWAVYKSEENRTLFLCSGARLDINFHVAHPIFTPLTLEPLGYHWYHRFRVKIRLILEFTTVCFWGLCGLSPPMPHTPPVLLSHLQDHRTVSHLAMRFHFWTPQWCISSENNQHQLNKLRRLPFNPIESCSIHLK